MHDPLKYFRVEAREILEQLQSGLLEIERSGAQLARTQSLLRAAHTLKGAARVVKQLDIANLAHSFEELLLPVREVERALSAAEMEALLAVVDAIAERVRQLAPAPTQAPRTAQASERPRPMVAAAATSSEAAPHFAAPLEHVELLMDGVAELGFQLANARRAAPDLSRSQRLADELTSRLEPRRLAELSTQGAVTLRALASELGQRLDKLQRELPTSLERATRELGQVRDRVDQLRLVAAASIFGALERTARDAAVSLGKQAHFEARGGEIRLDSQVLTAVQHALVQAVRNAVAHGIEPAVERTQHGKPSQGRVSLDVQRRGRQICFFCRDDGRGVNVAEVRRQAERLGRIQIGSAAPSEDELLALLLRGGISTSAQVTEVAGRGVGLDLIREALAGVGGTVSISSEPGAGTNLVLKVPASLSALEALIVEVGGALHAIPLSGVVRALRVEASELSVTAEGTSLRFEDQVVPFLPLARLVRSARQSVDERKVWSAVVVQDGPERLALGVDRLLGAESLVARALPESVELDATVAGVTLDADGNPRLLLDPEGLVASAKGLPAQATPSAPRRRAVLVIDDSLTTRMLEQSILESAGYEVELATSGEQGLEKALARRYDLFLVDVEMPGMDGFTFVEQVRADPRLAATPAVLVTSRVSASDLARGKAAGASAHIAKGEFDQVDFLERIGRLTR
jgi:two-component system, chemotaxis family, sensor kinase CheA